MMTTSTSYQFTRDRMTSPALTVGPDDPAAEVVRVCLSRQITGVPVADVDGRPLGVVSIVDLRCNNDDKNIERRNAWLRLAADDETMSEADLEALTQGLGPVRELMASPAISVDEDAPIIEAARLISKHSIKRVVVTRKGRISGVVTRADLLRAFSEETAKAHSRDTIPASNGHAANGTDQTTSEPVEALDVSANTFRNMVEAYQRGKKDMEHRLASEMKQRQQAEVEELLAAPLLEPEWRDLIVKAQHTAERGGTECVIMRFPAHLCDDYGRAINLPDPNWLSSLRGKPALLAKRWDEELKPLGFRLAARIATFPNGMPGDVEMSLVWR